MKWAGKILGFFVGWITGGPFLATLGVVIGHMFDKGFSANSSIETPEQEKRVQRVFFKTTFLIIGYIAKSDGRISEEEILKTRAIMDEMNLTHHQRQEAIHCFTQGKQAYFNWEATLSEFYATCQYHPNLLKLFLEIQFQAANIRGQIAHEKREILKQLCQFLGFDTFNFSIFEQHSRNRQYRHQQREQPSYYQAHSDPLQEAYQALGVAKTASDAEVKKKYRQLMSQHHPDKLMAKGLPESKIKAATEKTQKIKSAYEQICKARGIK